MIRAAVEYMGFRNTDDRREYLLRIRKGEEVRQYTVGIPHTLFASGRVRFQEGPDICYLKLQRELANEEAPSRGDDFTITEAELVAYKEAHTPAPRPRRPAPPRPGAEDHAEAHEEEA